MNVTWAKRWSTAVAATALFVGWSSAAHAAVVIPLKATQVPTTAAAFNQECTGPFASLPAGRDGWHFVTNGSTSFQSVTLTFDGGVVGPITSLDPAAPSSGTGWSGYLVAVGNPPVNRHAYVFVTAGWTLLSGTASVTPDTAAGQDFELSHTCAGTPTTPTPSVPAGSGTAVPSGAPDTGGGMNFGSFTLGAAAILVACAGGLGLTFVRRRRELS